MDDANILVLDAASGLVRASEVVRDVGMLYDDGEFIPFLTAGTRTPVVVEFEVEAYWSSQQFVAVSLYVRSSAATPAQLLGAVRLSPLADAIVPDGPYTVALIAHDDILLLRATASDGSSLKAEWAHPQ
jgi:hypothetical protein